ncbi:3ef24d77-dc72-42b0-b832-152846c1274a [Thermothielavioides terrestris]|uniref:3ef24d77-dc72-42b0-b832-152846c1274a n=1 Tax=Thermothielavioides terrestris TaxID=2587410 RepID=A0A446BH94_9PEZI|nr:3ef24d77-dc72-42b0-b832-152846c1274a [Thermothielavioides terrestris]
MCRYYAFQHACAHTALAFAAFCPPAALRQNPCGERHIWQTIRLDEPCEDCCRHAAVDDEEEAEEEGEGEREQEDGEEVLV